MMPDARARQEIEEVLVRYAAGIDRKDWALLRSCFAEDCEADYGAIGRWHGAVEITAWMRDVHERLGPTLHRITNVAVWTDAGQMRARSYVDALVMDAQNRTGSRGVGFYEDELVSTGEGWKIARRRFTMVLLETGISNALARAG